MLTLAVIGCEKDSELDSALIGQTWKCVGFASTDDPTIIPIHPQQDQLPSDFFTITFNIDGTFTGSTENQVRGYYHLSGSRQLSFSEVKYSTLQGLMNQNIIFSNVLFQQVDSYEVIGSELRLYFDKSKQYLVFYHL